MSDFEFWKWHIGTNGSVEPYRKLEREELEKWEKDPNRRIICMFCGTDIDDNEERFICPRCQEYKGLVPMIPGWSCYQDSMDDSIHGGEQPGFLTTRDHPYEEVFAIEGYSQTLISGWGYACDGYGWADVDERRLTEGNLKRGGVYGEG